MIPIDKHILGSPRRPCFGLVSDDQLGESLRLLNPPEFQVVLPSCEPPPLFWGFVRKLMSKLSCTSRSNMFQ